MSTMVTVLMPNLSFLMAIVSYNKVVFSWQLLEEYTTIVSCFEVLATAENMH